LLSFQVATYWRVCRPSGCVVAADSSATPFSARRYVIGHADVGLLRVIQTATEVVETDPSFSFQVRSASLSATTSGPLAVFPPHAAPRTEFVNGTPEPRTASTQEYFQVDPPHFSGTDGRPHLSYRIDGGSWHAMAASHIFSTGTLAVGVHRVGVRTSNSAGSSIRSFGWRVVPMPAPQACIARPHRACWYPPHLDSTGHPMRWDWQIGLGAPRQRTGARAVDIYDVDGFLTTAAQLRAIHRTWQAATLPHPRTYCYLDLAWEDYRPDGSAPSRGGAFPANTLGRIYYGYPQERWVDLRQLDALKPMIDARIAMCARKGFDAIELDDIDSFEPASTTGFNLTPQDAQNFLAYVDNEIHRQGMAVLWKNTGVLSWWGRDYSDGAVVEECYTYSECLSSDLAGSSHAGIMCTVLAGAHPCGWDDFTTDMTSNQPTGKWVGEAEYGADHFVCDPGQSCAGNRAFSAYCAAIYSQSYGFSAVKFNVNLDGSVFFPCPTGT
jgi:Glycoside-hydrolase family GH114